MPVPPQAARKRNGVFRPRPGTVKDKGAPGPEPFLWLLLISAQRNAKKRQDRRPGLERFGSGLEAGTRNARRAGLKPFCHGFESVLSRIRGPLAAKCIAHQRAARLRGDEPAPSGAASCRQDRPGRCRKDCPAIWFESPARAIAEMEGSYEAERKAQGGF